MLGYSLEQLLKNPEKVVKDSREGFSRPLAVSAFSGLLAATLVALTALSIGIVDASLFAAISVSGVALGLLGPAISAATVHPLVYLFGGRRYESTYKVFAFHAPVSVLGALPGVNIVAVPALLFLEARAIKRLHSLSYVQALLAVGLPGLGLVAIGAAVILFLEAVNALPPALATML